MSAELVWDEKKREWVTKEEYEAKKRAREALKELLEEIEFDIEIDLKTGKGKMKLKR